MSHAKNKAAQNGPDWYDVLKLQSDLHASYQVSSCITFETIGDARGRSVLCIITAVACGADNVPGVGGGTSFPVELHDLSALPRRIHETLCELYSVFETVGTDPQ